MNVEPCLNKKIYFSLIDIIFFSFFSVTFTAGIMMLYIIYGGLVPTILWSLISLSIAVVSLICFSINQKER